MNTNLHSINQLKTQLDASTTSITKKSTSFGRTFEIWHKGLTNEMPKWAARHIDTQKQLEKAVNEMRSKGEKIPADVIVTLERSKEATRMLANKVNYTAYRNAILPAKNQSPQINKYQSLYSDPTKLLTALNPQTSESHSNMREWELNFGLLHSAYQRTNNEETKTTIRFLMANYLEKAAYFNTNVRLVDLSEEDAQSYENMLQIGQLTCPGYHRMNTDIAVGYLHRDSTIDNPRSIMTDTIEIEGFYNIGFVPTPDLSKTEDVVDIFVREFEANLSSFPNENMEFPFIIDVTSQLGQSLITNDDPEKIKEYELKKQQVKGQIQLVIKQASEKIKAKHPENKNIQEQLEDYLLLNTVVISRAKINKHLGVASNLSSMFKNNDFVEKGKTDLHPYGIVASRNEFQDTKLNFWTNATGIGIGAVNFRKQMAIKKTDPAKIGKPLDYSVGGKTGVELFKRPGDLLEYNVFKTLTNIGKGEQTKVGEAQIMFAKTTSAMMTSLLSNIDLDEWNRKQNDPVMAELTQNALLRASQHIATGLNHIDDFRQFSQAMDRTHAELTTLLLLYAPFGMDSFESNYRAFIQPSFPDTIEPSQVGIAKSAMNVFSGVNAVIIQSNPNPVRICGAHSYFEEAHLVGGNLTLEKALNDPQIKKIDMYVAEFYHNMDIDPNHTNYQKGTVISDIRNIFEKKPETDSLTVTLDNTIDFTQSEDVKQLLKEFEKEIKEGKLNIVVFRSGQKFDMMGLDNYYGSPFYMVNNGSDKWKEFERIKTDEVFQTDELSQQFFSWMAATGPELVDQYKSQIFDNTANILAMVPDSLKPKEGSKVSISTFEEGVKTPFIEIKIDLEQVEQRMLFEWVQENFISQFVSEEKLVYMRSSFGFPHANLMRIGSKLRINPGADPSDNILFQKFFIDFEKKLTEMSSTQQ